jgi:hypothetical protein
LGSLNPGQRRALLEVADKKHIEAIYECVLNTLNGNVPLTPCEKKKIKKHKKILRKIAAAKNSWKKKKREIIQSGGAFLPALIAPILGGVLSALLK